MAMDARTCECLSTPKILKYKFNNYFVMLEPVANIKTLLIEGICSPINCCHRVIADLLWETS